MAHGTLLAGLITNRIFYLAAALPDFKIEIAVLIQLAAATLAPVVPLALTMMPLEELLKRLLGILF